MNDTENNHVLVWPQLGMLGGILLLIFAIGYLPTLLPEPERLPTTNIAVINTEEHVVTPADVEIEDPFATVAIRGEAAFVWDVQAKRALYQKNPDEELPLASVTKLMTALIAHELLRGTESVPVTLSAIRQDGVSNFVDGETFTLQNLSDLTLISSSNDGAFAIATAVGSLLSEKDEAAAFVQAMNIRADELGLQKTSFRNPTGLDISTTEAGAMGSARDMVFLMEYILEHEPNILANTTKPAMRFYNDSGAYHDVANTNAAIPDIAGLIGSKTGYTELAGGNLAIAFDAAPNRPIIVVVLGSTRSERFSDVVTLSDAARLSINK